MDDYIKEVISDKYGNEDISDEEWMMYAECIAYELGMEV